MDFASISAYRSGRLFGWLGDRHSRSASLELSVGPRADMEGPGARRLRARGKPADDGDEIQPFPSSNWNFDSPNFIVPSKKLLKDSSSWISPVLSGQPAISRLNRQMRRIRTRKTALPAPCQQARERFRGWAFRQNCGLNKDLLFGQKSIGYKPKVCLFPCQVFHFHSKK